MAISSRRGRASALTEGRGSGRVMRCVAVVVVALGILSGCAPSAAVAELTPAERSVIREKLLAQNWKVVTARFPFAARPEVNVVHTTDDGSWPGSMVGCLRAAGFTVYVDGRYFQFGSTAGRSTEDFAIGTYLCSSRYPRVDDVMRYLDRDRLEALFRYLVGTVRPCLLLSGVPSEPPPSLSAYLRGVDARTSWNPYRLAWSSPVPASRLAFLEQLCPSRPAWLDVAE
ncbi:hypothetical protein F1C58_06130 [Glaciihabitans sp. INWT7]|uniref:hypothetical protein n=1 Tax=Glaciihabitans sp. INWT7 TaxID=2596912 RepID=UPI001629EA3E|nr:hypothetical protein [Glaciihabitans sp. INWT7]QNE46528.1 hypothetical protein F1C58_06130 [Glaciihabitans sp. INWT7]